MKQTDSVNQMDLIDIYRIFHPNTKEYTFFIASHGWFSKIEHIISHKASIHRYQRINTLNLIRPLQSTAGLQQQQKQQTAYTFMELGLLFSISGSEKKERKKLRTF